MAEINVELKGEDINQAVADAIVKSVLGDALVKGVNEYLKREVSSGYNSTVQKIIDAAVREQIVRLVMLNLPMIEEEVRKQMTAEMVTKVTAAAIEKFNKGIY